MVPLFRHGMLGQNEVMEDTGQIKWDLALVLALAWVICFMCAIKGIRSTGKVRNTFLNSLGNELG